MEKSKESDDGEVTPVKVHDHPLSLKKTSQWNQLFND